MPQRHAHSLAAGLVLALLASSCGGGSSNEVAGQDATAPDRASAPELSDDSAVTSASSPSTEPATQPSLQPGSASSPGTEPATEPLQPGSVTAPDVPQPPPVPAAPEGDPATQAAAMVTATAPGAEGVEAAWLAAYDLARIPVLNDAGSGLGSTGDDPLGPGWWEVWMVSGGAAGQGMHLSDVLKIVVSPDEESASEADAASAAVAFIDDLRLGLESGDPAAVFTAAFIDGKAQQAGTPVSPLDPALDLAATTIDPATAHLIVWVALRSEASAYGADGASVSGLVQSVSRPAPRRSPPPPQACSQLWGNDQVTWVTNWVTSKVTGGVNLPGLQVKGLLEKIAELNPHIVSADQFQKFSKIAGRVNALTSVASAVMQYAALDIGGAGETLDRTRTTTDGKTVTLRFDILLNPEKLPDGNNKALCALSFLLNGLGVSFSFPSSGFLAGVSVVLTGGDGFGERVLFGNFEHMKQDTDANGSIFVLILGKAQKKTIPETAPRVDKEYTLEVEATPEPVDGNSLFNAMFDGLVFAAAPNPLAALALVLDIMKTAHWDLPDQIFPMQDWEAPAAYQVVGGLDDWQTNTAVCDVMKPFTLTGILTMDFSGGLSGTYQYSGGPFGAAGSGTYTISLPNGPGQPGTMTGQGEGQAGGETNTGTEQYTLTPIPPCAG